MRQAPLLIFFFSGAAALGLQVVWSQMLGLGLGHELPAVVAVVCAFMGGMAIGSWLGDHSILRQISPERAYALCEFVAGFWAISLAYLLPVLADFGLRWIGPQPSTAAYWTVAFLMPMVALLPATAAMGATMPVMQRLVSQLAGSRWTIGALYMANTAGAALGVFTVTFFLLPEVGFRQSALWLGGLDVVCGMGALFLVRVPRSRDAIPQIHSLPKLFEIRRLHWTLAFTGFLSIGLETLAIRALSQFLENTIFTFAIVLAVYLFYPAIGAALYHRWAMRSDPARLLGWLLVGTSSAIAIGAAMLPSAERIYLRLTRSSQILGSIVTAEFAVASIILGLAGIGLGALFAHLVQAAADPHGGGIGSAVAWNTLGGALGAALVTPILLPWLGVKWSIAFICLGYLILLPQIKGQILLSLLCVAGLLLWSEPPREADGRELVKREGSMAAVAVLEDAAGRRVLKVNSRFQMGGTGAAESEWKQGHVPLLLHPAPRKALFLGLGTGITHAAAGWHTGLAADGVELLAEVVEVMPQFRPFNEPLFENPGLRIKVADARRFVRSATGAYDVIVADLFHPARDGAGALYTVEHFQAIRERLGEEGLFCQWLPLFQVDRDTLRIIVRTFLEVFPDGQAWLLHFNIDAPVAGLIARKSGPLQLGAEWVETRLRNQPVLAEQLQKLALADSIRLAGLFLAGTAELRRFAGEQPLNTDDHPVVLFRSLTSILNARNAPESLFSVLAELKEAEAAPPVSEPVLRQRVEAYLMARDIYLRSLWSESRGAIDQAMEECIQSAAASPDFTLGYARCLSYAAMVAPGNKPKARELLRRLNEAQPGRPVAAEMLKRLEQ